MKVREVKRSSTTVCDSLRLSCLHDRTKTAETAINKLVTYLILDQKVKVTGSQNTKTHTYFSRRQSSGWREFPFYRVPAV